MKMHHVATTMTMPGTSLMFWAALIMLIASVIMLVQHTVLVRYVAQNRDGNCGCGTHHK